MLVLATIRYLVLQLLMSRRSLGYNCQVFLCLLTNPINIHMQNIKHKSIYRLQWRTRRVENCWMAVKFKSQKEDWSTWTFGWLPTYLTWTIVDIWLTTYLLHLVHVVCEWPLSLKFFRILFISLLTYYLQRLKINNCNLYVFLALLLKFIYFTST